MFRHEVRSCHFSRIEQRELLTFETQAPLRLVDLRGLEAHYPVLQSMRYETSQAFAVACRQQGLRGVLYALVRVTCPQSPYQAKFQKSEVCKIN
jgi:hypothetical protein